MKGIKVKYVILALVIVFVATFFYGRHLGLQKIDNASMTLINAQNKEITRLQLEINDKTTYLTQIEQELKTVRKAKKDGDITAEELRKLSLKRLNEITRLNTEILILLDSIQHNGTIIHVDTVVIEGKPANAILLPFTFQEKNEYLDLMGGFNSQGKLRLHIKIPLSVDVWTGTDKKTDKPIAKVTTDNKYISIVSINSVKTDIVKPKRYGIGIQMGYGFAFGNPVKTSPYVGVGVAYNFIRF